MIARITRRFRARSADAGFIIVAVLWILGQGFGYILPGFVLVILSKCHLRECIPSGEEIGLLFNAFFEQFFCVASPPRLNEKIGKLKPLNRFHLRVFHCSLKMNFSLVGSATGKVKGAKRQVISRRARLQFYCAL